ncbi:MAG: glycoside hydrolase family 32 protein, partial [Deltaproteobacteria bacterium]
MSNVLSFNAKWHQEKIQWVEEYVAQHKAEIAQHPWIHWEHQPEALAPSENYDDWEGGGIFTGSAIEHQDELILFYTGCTQDRQMQCMARSSDGLIFSKSEQKPVTAEPPPEINPHD